LHGSEEKEAEGPQEAQSRKAKARKEKAKEDGGRLGKPAEVKSASRCGYR